MNFTVKGCTVRVDFSFVLILSFAALLNADDLLLLLLFSGIHELSHLVVLLACGGKARCLKFSFYGVALKYDDCLPVIKDFFVVFAGPAASLALYIILGDSINLMLFLLNVLPIYPLDGGRLLRLLSYKASKVTGGIFMALFFALSLWVAFYYHSLSLLLTAVYIFAYTFLY